MPIPSSINDLSTTAGSNSPAGSESPSLIDDYLRTYASFIALLRDQTALAPQTIASAATTDIGAAVSNVIYVSGTTTITALGTAAAGVTRTVKFLGALTLTHNASALILPGTANITTAANDIAVFQSLGSGNWQCAWYSPANGTYGRSNILGTVSQASGVPTGAIIETGSNANGTYIKFADGTMICLGQPAVGIDQTTTTQAYSANFNLPATFINVGYKVSINSTGVNVTNVFQGYCRGNPFTTSALTIVQYWNFVQTYTYTYIAIGRWF